MNITHDPNFSYEPTSPTPCFPGLGPVGKCLVDRHPLGAGIHPNNPNLTPYLTRDNKPHLRPENSCWRK